MESKKHSSLFCFAFCFETLFWDKVSLYSPGCLETHYADQTSQTQRDPPASASWVLGSKVCSTTPNHKVLKLILDTEWGGDKDTYKTGGPRVNAGFKGQFVVGVSLLFMKTKWPKKANILTLQPIPRTCPMLTANMQIAVFKISCPTALPGQGDKQQHLVRHGCSWWKIVHFTLLKTYSGSHFSQI